MVKYPIIPAESCIFREQFINDTFVFDNGGTSIAAPTINNGVTFNGTTQYISYGRINDLGTGSFSFRFKVSFPDVSIEEYIFSKHEDANNRWYVRKEANGALFFFSYINSAIEISGTSAAGAMASNGVEYDVVIVADRGDTLRFYVDGVESVGSVGIFDTTANNDVAGDFEIGKWSSGYGNFTIKDFSYYTKALTAEEITDLTVDSTFPDVDVSKAEIFLPLRTYNAEGGNDVTRNLGMIATTDMKWGDGSTASTYPTLVEDNGASFSTDYIRIEGYAALGLNSVSDPISVGVMVKLDTVGTNQTMIENSLNWLLTVQGNGTVGLQFNDAGNAYHRYKFSDSALDTNKWYHICATYSGSDDLAGNNVYINGVLQGTSISAWHEGITNGGSVAAIGIRTTNFVSTPLTGKLKFPFVFMSELSATQVKWLSDKAFREMNI